MKEEDYVKKMEAAALNIGKALLGEGKHISLKMGMGIILIFEHEKPYFEIQYHILDPDQTKLDDNKKEPKKKAKK